MEWWRREAHADWENLLDASPRQPDEALRAATYAGRPFGSDEFLREMTEQFDRHWTCGRPKEKPPGASGPGRRRTVLVVLSLRRLKNKSSTPG